MADAFNPEMVNLTAAADDDDMVRNIICFINAGGNEYNGNLGTRISALFVIGIVSSAATFFPVMAARVRWLRVPLYGYLFARYFGAGVIVATAFIHLLDPAYKEIGPDTCVGHTGGWAQYSWAPAIALVSVLFIFLMDFGAERYVETKYGMPHNDIDLQDAIVGPEAATRARSKSIADGGHVSHQFLHSGDQREGLDAIAKERNTSRNGRSRSHGHAHPHEHIHNDEEAARTNGALHSDNDKKEADTDAHSLASTEVTRAFATQIAAFLILEFGVVFHSVIIGLNLGTAGTEFSTLYVVLVFHQSFEGLGVGARLSAIPFPYKLGRWMPWALCAAYGLTTPVAIAIGLGLRTTYDSGSFTANVISGVLDSISAGILMFTGLVELLARDFLFDPNRTKDNRRLAFMIGSVLLGVALMALLGKWA